MAKENSRETMISQITNKMYEYRKLLLENGFSEPEIQDLSYEKWYFYKQITSLTAFAVNFKRTDVGVEVVYGYASTAFTLMKGDENSLNHLGIWDINLREELLLTLGCNDNEMFERVKKMYDKYKNVEKDELLEIVKQKRKEFIRRIAERLKPLGFKKKGNTWRRTLEGEYYLMFDADKSSYADEYYFEVVINTDDRLYARECFYTRVYPNNLCPLDWQLFPENEFISFLDNEILSLLQHIINTPLAELGKEKMIWNGCTCDRDNCNVCWVEKNLWETDEEVKYENEE